MARIRRFDSQVAVVAPVADGNFLKCAAGFSGILRGQCIQNLLVLLDGCTVSVHYVVILQQDACEQRACDAIEGGAQVFVSRDLPDPRIFQFAAKIRF